MLSGRSLCCGGTFNLISTKACLRPDAAPCIAASETLPSFISTGTERLQGRIKGESVIKAGLKGKSLEKIPPLVRVKIQFSRSRCVAFRHRSRHV